VYAVEQPGSSSAKHATADEEADGYRITMEKQATTLFPERQLFLTRKGATGWSKPQPLSLRLPSFRKAAMVFAYALDLRLSVSPNGKSLAFTYLADPVDAPPGWQQSAMVRTLAAGAGVVQFTPVINLTDGSASLPFEGPWAWTVPFWSRDSQSFVITAVSPVGTSWESKDGAQDRTPIDAVHQFEVRLTTGTVHLVRLDLHGIFDAPLAWRLDGDLLLHTADETLTHMRFEDGAWRDASQVHLAMPGRFRNAELASDGNFVVGDYETPSTPPSFFLYRIGESGFQHLVGLNPQFDGLTIAPYREVHWDTSTGYHASGFLFVPPDYDPQKVYPLVIHAYPAASNFFCDSGVNHDPSFAPQPLANAGIMYLIRILPDGARQGEEQAHYPKGYPGNLAEAAFHTDIWDSAVDQLSRDGLIDPKRVGIIAFSRSGWFTEFALTHARTHYAAATLADNVQYSLGEYWMIHSDNVLKGWDAMFGGPPYGATLQNWLEHSISFNLPKIHTPVLMEVMGYGNHYLNDNAPPSNLALKWEIFAGLSRLQKPVEMYYYPLETHQPENPRARLASLERNLDWYTFWLNGVEREVARDSQQSVRWRELRQSHFEDESSPAR
jgi:dipeptidyl aminopeptidase/acylaminoacyl peptidase